MAPPRTGTRYITPNGYIKIWVGKENPYARKDGSVLEHRDVVMKYLGRRLRKNERVHHLNGNKQDNRQSNLVVMTDSDHSKHHHPKLLDKWSVKHFSCKACHRTTHQHLGHGLCQLCYHAKRRKVHPVTTIPSRRNRICAVCENTFGAWKKNQRCCSRRCGRILFWREHPDHPRLKQRNASGQFV